MSSLHQVHDRLLALDRWAARILRAETVDEVFAED